ncbi:GNAT acetyltransferase 2-domain-containing protein [Tricharina praecox]|uniref:GNAT acetyltransferase 2-domain-containing protein n=1 Tax=Tricharina praecox TaxID=43433 RepID=UPI00222117C4|nr:GNAT acetyltransferase 2-domain-containing protein [Tricharina praecox]KAI5846932.1 GNAT acetyltransferase 2-domain-containing protein [Tricharina praecox]
MVKKAVDKRIPDLIRNGVQEKKRSFFVVVGDRGKDVILNLHYILGSADPKQNKSVLWAYKNKLLGFTSHRKKREAKIKKEVKRGIREANTEDPFELFISLTDIRYVYYKETEKILGNTYGMCILQDFEALTPNLLARTIETVEGGGLVVLLLKTMSSLKQLYTMSMDVHSRYRTEAHGDVVARFNERFILSLSDCANCLVVDDELNVLPISGGRNVQALPPVSSADEALRPEQKELQELKESLADVQPSGSLVEITKTVDQAKAVMTFVDAIADKSLRSTVTLTAGRGRGKSAALGLAIAAAIAYGYSNIFITSPSPENLKTLFSFIFKGFDALNYSDHLDYDIIQSTNPAFNKAIVRVNVHRQHRQTIQYIQPQDAHVLGQAELVVIDEAAAIPLPLVKKLMGPYLVFMASTINGYEGTGRSLSLKLIQQLRDQSRGVTKVASEGVTTDRAGKAAKASGSAVVGGRTLREATLDEPIRYAPGDPVEKWLNNLLCLDATLPPKRKNNTGTPSLDKCELFAVSRDSLFSYHPVSERFLQKMMALYVASHYKNSPNDLQLMSDAPAHQLFVLLAPAEEGSNHIPDPLVVIQVALEGQISKKSVQAALSRGKREGGDMIPWLVSQQFQDEEFAGLSGARVVRIATNPDYVGMGYGKRALDLLTDFYEGKFASLEEDSTYIEDEIVRVTDEEIENSQLQTDTVKVRDPKSLPPLLLRLSEKRPELLDYLGVSYGLTDQLHKFWKKSAFVPVYLRQTATELTGEHSCVMIKTLADKDSAWLGAFATDFRKRFLELLSYEFRKFNYMTPLLVLESANAGAKLAEKSPAQLTKAQLDELLSPFDLKRLESYADNMLDYHVILDMVPQIANLHFTGRLKNLVSISPIQSAVLMAIGLQRKTLEGLEKELGVGNAQVLSMFQKIMRKVATAFRELLSKSIEETLPKEAHRKNDEMDVDGGDEAREFAPVDGELRDELEEAGEEAMEGLRLKELQREMVNELDLSKYEIPADKGDWTEAEKQIRKAASSKSEGRSTIVSVKTGKSAAKRKAGESAAEIYEEEVEKFKNKKPKKGKR